MPAPLRSAVAGITSAMGGQEDVAGRLQRLSRSLRAQTPEFLYHQFISRLEAPSSFLAGEAAPIAYRERAGAIDGLRAKMMYLDTLTYLPDDVLVKVDRASMAVGLEVRSPLLDQRVVEFAWGLPESSRSGSEGGKPILRALLRRYLPDASVDRPKMGFAVPVAEWLRGPLRPWAEALLNETKIREQGYLAAEKVRAVWEGFLTGKRRHHRPLWNILMFQAWLGEQL
jgi:asparagine synthase (glutamine-hydrolysing)